MEGAFEDNTSLRVASFSCYLDTAKEKLAHKVSAKEVPIVLKSGKPQHPTTKPPFTSNFSYSNDNKDSLTNLRVDSFSFRNKTAAADKFVVNIPAPIQDPAAFTFPQETRKNGEISIFGADKYFSMKLDYQMGIKRDSKNEPPVVNLPRAGSNSGPRTPSLCSQASSWNNQTALLPVLQRNASQAKQRKAIGRRIFSGFGCQGPCFDKKGVRVNEAVAEEAHYGSKPTRTRSERIDRLALAPPPNSSGTEDSRAKQQQHQGEAANVEESRISIEVFGSGATMKGDHVAKNMERKLSMLTWDAIPKSQILPSSTSCTVCDDMASEASSDLFEIENISGSIRPIYATSASAAAAADDMSICMSPASHYAPSEASIQWSVVTASAADYDYNDETTSVSVAGDVMSRSHNAAGKCYRTRGGGGKEAQKIRHGGLLGCKSQKAVDVAENLSHETNEKAKHQGLDLSVSLGKSQAIQKH